MKPSRLVLAWFALLALAATTVLFALLPIGPLKPAAALLIAFAKALIIYWCFMELRREGSLIRMAVFASCAWLFLIVLIPFLQMS